MARFPSKEPDVLGLARGMITGPTAKRADSAEERKRLPHGKELGFSRPSVVAAEAHAGIKALLLASFLACAQTSRGGTIVFEEHFDGPSLPSTMTYFADPDFQQWIIDGTGRLYADRFDFGSIPMAAVSQQTFLCGTYRYSADMGRPSISVNPPVSATPGGSGTGLLFGQWVVYFGPGHPNGNLKLGLWVPNQNHPTVLIQKPLGFTPALDAMHHLEAVVITLQSGALWIEVAISGLGDDGQQHTFGFSYISALDLGTGRAGVFLNRLNIDDAYYDNLIVEQIDFADSDSDGVCDLNDRCPGFDDNADADGDGLSDGCDACASGAGSGDTDASGRVDLDDYTNLVPCLLGPGGGLGTTGCECFDQDGDEDVDLSDVARFQAEFTGQS